MTINYTQPASNMMSIGAITSPCTQKGSPYKKQESIEVLHDGQIKKLHLPSLNRLGNSEWLDSSLIEFDDNTEVNHWMNSSKQTISNNEHAHQKHTRYGSETISSSSSFSSSLSNDQDYDSVTSPIMQDCVQQCNTNHLWLKSMYTLNRIDKRSKLTEKSAELSYGNMEKIDIESMKLLQSISCDYSDQESGDYMFAKGINTPSYKPNALATRRARNKLASAKYRAKKQALTHAMQNRIMQLATQVITLRDELLQSKKNRSEIEERYERLLKCSEVNSSENNYSY